MNVSHASFYSFLLLTSILGPNSLLGIQIPKRPIVGLLPFLNVRDQVSRQGKINVYVRTHLHSVICFGSFFQWLDSPLGA
jgi:hypothetical protein